MRGSCPNCEKETELKKISARESIEVKGESIEVDMSYYACLECGIEFEDPHSTKDPLAEAYREYRRRHGMHQPEEMRAFRKKYGLTQNELSDLLGWGGSTISRYENGALQDDTHEKTLCLAMDSGNLLMLIKETPNILSDEKRNRLIKELQEAEEEAHSFTRIYEERFGSYEADDFSGYKTLNIEKLFAAILFFCEGGVLKTKLNKLLFYTDFKHFKEYTVSITGAHYARLPFGPVLDNYEHYFATLIHEEKLIKVREVNYPDGSVGEEYIAEKAPNLNIFSVSELKILTTMKEHFKSMNATQISELSHQEKGYQETPNSELISYNFAEHLNV